MPSKIRQDRTKWKQLAAGQFESWLKPDITFLDNLGQEVYLRKYRAMELYCSGETECEIEKVTGVSKQLVTYYVKRCLAISPDGEPWGCRALVSFKHIKIYERVQTPQKKLPDAKGGHTGVLQYTLRLYPELEESLLAEILKSKKLNHGLHEHKISATKLHCMFISKLKALGAPLDAWPFNTKYQGLRTISSYMKHLLEDNFGSSVTARGSSEAKAHLQVGRGKHTLIDAQDPYDVVEMDSYYLDCRMSVFFATPQGTQVSVLINRIWLVAMIDRASKAIISYKLIYRSEVSAADVIEVLRLALSPTHIRPPAVVEGIKYPTGGGLPLEVIPECRHALWSVLMLDNALAHLSSKISESARKEVAFALNYGPVGYPMRRPNIEHSFKEFAKNLFWRLITTTGSNPQNGRAEDAEDAAMIYKVEAAHIEHLLDVEIAQYNCRPSEGLFFLSPLEFIQQKLKFNDGHLIIRRLMNVDIQGCNKILHAKEVVYVRGSQKSGRLPYIQLDRVRYTSSILKDASMLVGKAIIVEINESDMRTLEAFTRDGNPLGTLVACGRWSETKHDRRTRKAINSLLHRRLLYIASTDDPVTVYLDHLGQVNKKVKHDNPAVSPDKATEAKRVADEAGVLPVITVLNIKKDSGSLNSVAEGVGNSGIGRPMPDLNVLIKSRFKP